MRQGRPWTLQVTCHGRETSGLPGSRLALSTGTSQKTPTVLRTFWFRHHLNSESLIIWGGNVPHNPFRPAKLQKTTDARGRPRLIGKQRWGDGRLRPQRAAAKGRKTGRLGKPSGGVSLESEAELWKILLRKPLGKNGKEST